MTARTSYLAPRTSYLAPRTSYLVPRTSRLLPRTSHLAPRTSHLAPRASHLEFSVARLFPYAQGRVIVFKVASTPRLPTIRGRGGSAPGDCVLPRKDSSRGGLIGIKALCRRPLLRHDGRWSARILRGSR